MKAAIRISKLPLTTVGTVPVYTHASPPTQISSENIMKGRDLSRWAEFVKAKSAQQYFHDITKASTVTSAATKRASSKRSRQFNVFENWSDVVIQTVVDNGLGYFWTVSGGSWFCILCGALTPHCEVKYIKAHYRLIHEYELTVATLKGTA